MLWQSSRKEHQLFHPNQPVVPVLNRKESCLNANAIPSMQTSVPKQHYLSGDPCFRSSATERKVSRLTTSIDSIVTVIRAITLH